MRNELKMAIEEVRTIEGELLFEERHNLCAEELFQREDRLENITRQDCIELVEEWMDIEEDDDMIEEFESYLVVLKG